MGSVADQRQGPGDDTADDLHYGIGGCQSEGDHQRFLMAFTGAADARAVRVPVVIGPAGSGPHRVIALAG